MSEFFGGHMKRFFIGLMSGLLAFSAIVPAQAAPVGSTITISAPVANLYFAPIEFVATVRASNGTPVAGELVTWGFTGPVSTISGSSFTDSLGNARIVVTPTTAASANPTTLVATARISTNTFVSTSISRTGIFLAPSPSSFNLTVEAPAVIDSGKSIPLLATLKSVYGTPISGATITWSIAGVGLISNGYGFTDSNGRSVATALYGSSDAGVSTITATAQLGSIRVSKDFQVTVGSPKSKLDGISVFISKASNRIRLEVLGADGFFIVLEVDGVWTMVEVIGNRFIETFPTTRAKHEVAVFVDDELFAQETLTFAEVNKTITCRALDRVLTVTSAKPVCPIPFKLSKKAMPSNVKVTTCYRTGAIIRMAKPLVACPPGYWK